MHMFAMITVFNAEATSSAYTARTVQKWYTGSGIFGINNRCLACMSHYPADFVGDLK